MLVVSGKVFGDGAEQNFGFGHVFAQRAGNLLDGGKIFVDDFFRFFGNLLFLHFHVGHVFDNAADYLLFVDVEDDDVKQFVVETDMFAMNVLFQICLLYTSDAADE